jgi:hypothetical protein
MLRLVPGTQPRSMRKNQADNAAKRARLGGSQTISSTNPTSWPAQIQPTIRV